MSHETGYLFMKISSFPNIKRDNASPCTEALLHRSNLSTVIKHYKVFFQCCGFLVLFTPGPVNSEPQNPVQSRTLAGALAELAARSNVSFIVEGVPLRSEMSDDSLKEIAATTSLLSRIHKIAKTFDYSVINQGNVYGLQKRYTDPRDLPVLSSEEVALETTRALSVIDRFCPHESAAEHRSAGQRFVEELSTPNLRSLMNNDLKFVSLNSAARQSAMQLATHESLNSSRGLLAEADSYLGPQSQSVVFKWEMPADFLYHTPIFESKTPAQPFFGFHISSRSYTDPKYFVPLSGMYAKYSGFRGGTIYLEFHFADTPEVKDFSDPSAPESDISSTDMHAITLQQAVAVFNTDSKGLQSISIDAGLESKTVMIIGSQHATLLQNIQMIATLYGLGVKAGSSNGHHTYRLTMPLFTMPTQYADIQESLQSTVPVSLYRELHLGELVTNSVEDPRDKHDPNQDTEESIDELKAAMQKARSQKGFDISVDLTSVPSKIHIAAIAHLRRLVEPKLKPSANTEISLMSLDRESKDAFATTAFTGLLTGLATSTLSSPTKPFKYLNEMVLGGFTRKSNDGTTRIVVSFYLLDHEGKPQFRASCGEFPFSRSNELVSGGFNGLLQISP
jgi:hypothetical protein